MAACAINRSSANTEDLLLQPLSVDPQLRRKQLKKSIKLHLDKTRLAMTYSAAHIQSLIDVVKCILKEQKTLVKVLPPIRIVGDLHAQYTDLRRILYANGTPPKVNYMFLGDYVDRGKYSLETLMLLFSLKALYPKGVLLLRGNHECERVNRSYGFYDEMQRRELLTFYTEFNMLFNYMPLAGLIKNKILCMHGGISKDIACLSDIKHIERPTQADEHEDGRPMLKTDWIAIDLLWADPSPTKINVHNGYAESHRGISLVFDMQALEVFCERLKIDCVVRGHQVVPKGFQRMGLFPNRTRIVTVFSAPNYCNEFDNSAAVMIIDENMKISFSVLEATADANETRQRQNDRALTPSFDIFPNALKLNRPASPSSSQKQSPLL